MSEEKTNQNVNNQLTERVNKAFIAKDFTLLNGGTDNLVMINAEKNESPVDILVTYEALEQVVNDLKPDIQKLSVEVSNEL